MCRRIRKKKLFSHFVANRVALFLSVILGQKSDKKVALIDNKLASMGNNSLQEKFNEVSETKLSYENFKPVSIFNFPVELSSIDRVSFSSFR